MSMRPPTELVDALRAEQRMRPDVGGGGSTLIVLATIEGSDSTRTII
jgi:hypothetical protein